MKCRKIIKEYAGKDTEPEYTRCNYTINPVTGICNGCGYEHGEKAIVEIAIADIEKALPLLLHNEALLTDVYKNKKRQLQERLNYLKYKPIWDSI